MTVAAEPVAAFRFGPQPGPQTAFLSSPADIVFYGGAAGGGKSYGLLLEPLRYLNNPRFGAVIFRRSYPEITNKGGLWDDSHKLYQPIGAVDRITNLEWTFPSGMTVRFAHLQEEKTVYQWKGAQVPLIGFDEVTSFTEFQFFYMLSRNRSMSGVPGYIRATCNPDPDSWVRRLIDWWIGPDGLPIDERSGVVRWFVRRGDTLVWAETREELLVNADPETMPKSFTFIPAKLSDNQILMTKDPSYKANLLMLSRVERERLLKGNWDYRPSRGSVFKEEWFPIVDEVPGGWTGVIRYWDRAGSKPTSDYPDPDWSRGVKVYAYPNGKILVADVKGAQDTPGAITTLIKNVASHDGVRCTIKAMQDPGSAGVLEAEDLVRNLSGYHVQIETVTGSKFTRAKPVSAQAEFGNVMVLRGRWNKDFFAELENFTDNEKDYDHDDQVDGLSGAYNHFFKPRSAFHGLDALSKALG